jgi:ABC-2 type transport system permease protein
MLVGLSAFWTQEIGPFQWIWEKLLFSLGGLILPLTMYPQWAQTIAYLTPFPSILGSRSALVIDHSLSSFLGVAVSLMSWCLFGSILLCMVYRKGLRILNIEGG